MYETMFGEHAAWFTVPALIGTVFFVFRILMLMIGAGTHDIGMNVHGGDFHVGGGGHFDAGHDAAAGGMPAPQVDAHSDSSHSFQVLSIQSVAAFMMGFGWAGLATYKGSDWHWGPVMVAGCLGGVAMVWLLGLLLKGMADLQSSGNIPIDAAMGVEGDVYVTVPSRGAGQVRLTVRERQRIYNATTGGEDLPTGTRVRVVNVNPDNTLTVARA